MNHVEPMLQAHPNHSKMESIPGLSAAVVACLDTTQAAMSCADACIAEHQPKVLMKCIRLDMDCAAITAATAAVLTRANEPDWRVIRAQLQACVTAAVACAEECEKHAREHAHCRLCAESCRTCERACNAVMNKIPTAHAAA